jgi:hypothetical protein
MQLQDFAHVVRSKNAGPRRITLDVIFHSDVDYLGSGELATALAIRSLPGRL